MKFTGLLFIVALACFEPSIAQGIPTENDVLVLDVELFWAAVHEFDRFFVAMYAPWCPWCQKLIPEMEKAAAILKEMKSDVKIAKLDCTVYDEICADLGVKHYPTIKIYNKETPTDYEGERTADAIVAALVNKAAAGSVDVATFNGFCEK